MYWLGALEFYIPPNSCGHVEMGYGFKISSERLAKPGFEPTSLGLQDMWLNHYIMDAYGMYYDISLLTCPSL